MEKLLKQKKRLVIVSVILSVCFVAGIPILIVGASHMSKDDGGVFMFVAGIIMTVCGFYGAPIAWINVGPIKQRINLLNAVLNQHFYTVEELSFCMGKNAAVVKRELQYLYERGYLVGYKFDGQKITLNQNVSLKTQKHTVRCEGCGAKVTFDGSQTVCPYCGGAISLKNQ